MKGYYKKEAETREVFEDGWFKTGDIGRFDADGFLVITDRKKDLIVTSGGKNIAPQPIENILKTSPYIANAVVIGDRRRFVSALIVPNFEKLEEYAQEPGDPRRQLEDLVRDKRIVDFLLAEVDRATPHLASYERIKKIAVLPRDFEIETGRDHAVPQGPAGQRHGGVPGPDRRDVQGRRGGRAGGRRRRSAEAARPSAGGSGLTGSGLAVQ